MNTILQIDIHSFSYKKKGYPKDETGNGGGFCFDCRGILNPGRVEEYKQQTGKDIGVINYLEGQTKMPEFIGLVQQLVSINIEDYLSRGFDHLQINFGCTGGQHRSVYAAETIAKFVAENFSSTKVLVTHDEQPQLNII
jgi:UPF0042 nucleotide-binding protein